MTAIVWTLVSERAEEQREQHGFAWAEIRPRFDYAELAGYGRIHPKLREMNETEAASFNANALRLDDLAIEIEGFDDVDARTTEDKTALASLTAEYDRLELENEKLREVFDPDEAARAGVIACLSHSGIRFELGLIRPEDSVSGGGLSDDGSGCGDRTTAQPAKPAISASLKQDLGWERAELVAAALSEDQWLARDAMIFQLVTQFFASRGFIQGAIAIRMTGLSGNHSRPDAKLPDAGDRLQASHDALDLTFLDDAKTEAEQFAAFRALGSQEKLRILARIVAMQIEPQLWSTRKTDSFTEALYGEAILNLHAVWRRTAANYWSRVSKGHILDTLHALGRAAPFRRNDDMLDLSPRAVIIFPGNGISENLVQKADVKEIAVWRPSLAKDFADRPAQLSTAHNGSRNLREARQLHPSIATVSGSFALT